MTLERFSVVAIENNLFSEKDQYDFLELEGKEHIEKRYMEVQERWDIIRMEIKEKLKKVKEDGEVDLEVIEDWFVVIDEMDERIDSSTPVFYPALLISLKILKLEV